MYLFWRSQAEFHRCTDTSSLQRLVLCRRLFYSLHLPLFSAFSILYPSSCFMVHSGTKALWETTDNLGSEASVKLSFILPLQTSHKLCILQVFASWSVYWNAVNFSNASTCPSRILILPSLILHYSLTVSITSMPEATDTPLWDKSLVKKEACSYWVVTH